MPTSILEIVRGGQLPTDADDILPLITNEDGTFLNQEGTLWDFKETWPFSYSDEYFGGLCRLICAFANTEGGLIVFGVNDKTRRGGMTKVTPNLDKMEIAFQQLTGQLPKFRLRRYQSVESGDFDVLLVSQKDGCQRPLRFLTYIKDYPPNVIYIRQGSSVRNATTNDIGSLYLGDIGDANADNRQPIGHLPPSPATVREFVGRMDAIDKIFNWLSGPEEPRAFLYGKGGSGKSTIAYQVFKSLKLGGNNFQIAGQNLERVIFISAKALYLNVENQTAEKFVGLDFRDERELYQGLLLLSDREIDAKLIDNVDYLKGEIRSLLDQSSCFIVIDDIDTLSTKDDETGMDFLFGCLWRAKKPSKVLYTLRNRPSQSISSSIEIPGMSGIEFNKFVDVCSEQFHVEPPSGAFRDTMLYTVSEGRPLVIESVIALRRTTGSYPDAITLFESNAGDDVRNYVFRREWDALDKTDRGREILVIIALHGKAIGFEDLVTVSRMDASKVRDALAATQEIFLTAEISGDETLFSLGALTKRFVVDMAKSLNYYEVIKTRVENFKIPFMPIAHN